MWDIIFFMCVLGIISYYILKRLIINIMIKKLEKKYDCIILPIIHHGISHINQKTLEDVITAIQKAKKLNKKIFAVLHTPGGYVFHSKRIAEMIEKSGVEVIGIIPHYAMSGGTYITLPMKKLFVKDFSVCGPLDPQIYYRDNFYSIRDLVRVKDEVDHIDPTYATTIETGKKELIEMRNSIKYYLSKYNLDKKEISRLVTKILDKHSHGCGLNVKELFGFKTEDMTDEMYKDFMKLIKIMK